MDWLQIVYVLLGAIASLILTAIIEALRKPSLVLEIENHPIKYYEPKTRPATSVKFLYVRVKNKEMPWPLNKFYIRTAALQCHGSITFHRLEDGTKTFEEPMTGRWSIFGLPEGETYLINGRIQTIYDINKINAASRLDIYPGDAQSMNIAARFDDDEDCYGWTNENLITEPAWRTPRWKLPKGRYLVKVNIFTAGEKCEGIFRLINDLNIKSFRLEPAQPSDKIVE